MAGNGQSATARDSMECHGVPRCAMACCETMCDDYNTRRARSLRKHSTRGQSTSNMSTMECHGVPKGYALGLFWNCCNETITEGEGLRDEVVESLLKCCRFLLYYPSYIHFPWKPVLEVMFLVFCLDLSQSQSAHVIVPVSLIRIYSSINLP